MKIKNLEKKEKTFLIYGLFITIAIILIPLVIRFLAGNTTLIGEQAYLHSSLAENIINSFDTEEFFVYGKDKTEIYYTPYHYLLAFGGFFIGTKIASILISILLSIGSLILFYFLLEKFMPKLFERFAVILAFILSPGFVYLSVSSTPHCLAIFLTLLGLWFFIKDNKYYLLPTILCFAIASLTSVFNGLLIILFTLLYSLKYKKKIKWMFFIFFVIMIIYFFMPVKFYYLYEVSTGNIIKEQISDFGGKIGFGIFHIILFFIGAIVSWKHKNKLFIFYIMIIPLIILLNYFQDVNLYLNFFVAIFVGLGIRRIRKIRWQFDIIKYLSFLIIICGLLFSTMSYTNRISSIPPDTETIDSLVFLQENSLPEDMVLSHYSNGYIIQNIAKRHVLIDSQFYSTPKLNEKLVDGKKIYESRNLETTKNLLDKYGIDYIWINEEMKNNLWKDDDEGLLFIFRNNETFKNIYSTDNIDIWKVIR